MTTIHANNPRDAISRLENMVAMAGIEMPLKAMRSQIASAVNLIVQASRLQDGTRRMTSITEITGMEGEVISMQEVFRFERLGIEPSGRIIGRFNATGIRSSYSDRFRQWGYDLPASIEISAAPLIYILIFVAVVVIVEGIYLTVFGKSISLNNRLSRRLTLLEKNANREQVLEQLRKEMNQHLNAQEYPALLDAGQEGAAGEHRLLAPGAGRDHGGPVGLCFPDAVGLHLCCSGSACRAWRRHGRGRRLRLG